MPRLRCWRLAVATLLALAVTTLLALALYSGVGDMVKDSTPSQTYATPLIATTPGISRSLVVASVVRENTEWVRDEFPGLRAFVYVVDNPHAPFTTPKNKGNEAMAYLTYIIDNYDALPDVSIFVHAHKSAWHDDALVGGGTAEALRRLRDAHVVRQGYFNLRCSWSPGCPAELDLTKPAGNSTAQETKMKAAWHELHPDDPLPDVMAQPCCAQFAASRTRIREVPLWRWVHYRDWLLATDLDDYHSGRVWEYTWQYVLAGESVFCPAPEVCYCEGYGICFDANR